MVPWIQTYSGGSIDPLNPDPAQIKIEDIAHALANTCRYTGHTRFFYSVAEHSVWVSYNSDPADALAGLLHDASEAYLCDIAAPVKQNAIFDGYRKAEARLQAAIYERFGLGPELPASVKTADFRMLATEAPQVLGDLLPGWELPEPYQLKLTGYRPQIAKNLFLMRFDALGGNK